ncbi:MAG: tyrosine-type recombinase/integrase [Eubacteriales bacterium]|nr:tyrosine-type recombinase/integrase [Eubacteriales bacterium]
MASIVERRNRFCVVYSYKDKTGKRRQKWETYKTMSEARKRKKEVEYRSLTGELVIPICKTVKDLFDEYVALYGKEKWALSTYSSNLSTINNYILPIIGDDKLENINTRFIEKYYQRLLRTPAVINPATGKRSSEFVTTSTIRDIHKILRSCFQQAVKWELMVKNPVIYATVPKHKAEKREIWTAETLMHALEVCDDERLKMALNLAFSCSLRMGELLGLTWDCVDISEESIAENRAFIYVDKELQRVDKDVIQELHGKDVILIFPEESKLTKTVRVLKLPKTESSVRKIFLPKSVAEMLVEWKAGQDKIKETLGDEYLDYNLVMATPFGLPIGDAAIRKSLKNLIKEHDLPPVVFHSLRHTSVTYKLKLNGGDIKAVQGDSGHAQINMVTDVYSHIIDDDRRKNAELFEEAFYEKKELDPSMRASAMGKTVELPSEVDAELLAKVLSNPEMAALLTTLARSLEGK